jgi:N-acetylmuramoyl-L-alanine amidase
MTSILGETALRFEHAQAWARSRGATDLFLMWAPLFWRYAPERGIRAEVAYAQAAKETAFGRFGGTVTPEHKNTCGLKTREGGDNGDPDAHARFPTWDVGVIAHLDHLALYAGAPGYPQGAHTPDPRHFVSIDGIAPNVEDLSGRWAGTGYGESLVELYLVPLLSSAWTPPALVEYATRDELNVVVTTWTGDIDAVRALVVDLGTRMAEAGRRLIG